MIEVDFDAAGKGSITIPENYEIDKENSTDRCIRVVPKQRYVDREQPVSGYRVDTYGRIYRDVVKYNLPSGTCVYSDLKTAVSARALAQISQIMANDSRFGGEVTQEEWLDLRILKYILCRGPQNIYKAVSNSQYHFLAFHTKEQRDLFFEENRKLVEDYLMIPQANQI